MTPPLLSATLSATGASLPVGPAAETFRLLGPFVRRGFFHPQGVGPNIGILVDDLLPEFDPAAERAPLRGSDPADAIDFGHRRPKEGLVVEVGRELVEEDLRELDAVGPLVPPSRPTIAKLRYAHHQVARLLTQGLAPSEISVITGYAAGTIGALQQDPTFRELLATYSTERAIAFADVLDRMRTAGITALEELQDRLNIDPAGWTKRELMEMAEMMLIKGQRPSGAPLGGSGPGIAISVSFVTPNPQGSPSGGTLIEMEPSRP